MATKGKLSAPNLDTGMEDADAAVQQDVIDTRDGGRIRRGEDIVDVEEDGIWRVRRNGRWRRRRDGRRRR